MVVVHTQLVEREWMTGFPNCSVGNKKLSPIKSDQKSGRLNVFYKV